MKAIHIKCMLHRHQIKTPQTIPMPFKISGVKEPDRWVSMDGVSNKNSTYDIWAPIFSKKKHATLEESKKTHKKIY